MKQKLKKKTEAKQKGKKLNKRETEAKQKGNRS